MEKMKKIVVLGGGTGSFTVLKGLKRYPIELTAVVNMVDDGGSTGILRDELGVLPPGDVRQCLVALSESSELMRKLMNYRFEDGRLRGHSFGNILITALEKTTGSFEAAVEEVGKILAIKGRVVPATTDKVRLVLELEDGTILYGENNIQNADLCNERIKKLFLNPRARANQKALEAIKDADLIVIGPGSIYTSLIPNLLIDGIAEAVIKSKAKKVFVVNLMNKKNKTKGFNVKDHVKLLESYLGGSFDYVLFNVQKPPAELLERYAKESELVDYDEALLKERRFIPIKAFSPKPAKVKKGDIIKRNLIRHDSYKLAEVIIKLLDLDKEVKG